jgi:hypothetical protein
MKNFDDIFSRKAKQAFENFNADHLAEEGWNSYVRKYVRKRDRVFVIPLWAKVASIAVLVTIGVLFTARINHRKAGEHVSQIAQVSQGEQTESAVNMEDTSVTKPEITAIDTASPVASPVIANSGQASEETISKSGQIRVTGSEKTGYRVSEPAGPVLAETVRVGEFLSPETIIAAEMPAGVNLPDNPIEVRLTYKTDTRLSPNPKKELMDLSDLPREKKTTTIMTGLSGMMASIDNTSSISQGVSIGFYVEQQLTRRISVRPGLAMAKHNYALDNMSGGSEALGYSAPDLAGVSGTTTSYEANMEVISAEVPVNLVISILKRPRSNLFITTGVSTVIYLNQHMSGNFYNTYTKTTVDSYSGEVSYESMTTSIRIESEQEVLNRVDFMGLANFSAGYSFPFGKTSHLLIEPFVQLPVKDLTSLNLRITYGGLSMKVQF